MERLMRILQKYWPVYLSGSSIFIISNVGVGYPWWYTIVGTVGVIIIVTVIIIMSDDDDNNYKPI